MAFLILPQIMILATVLFLYFPESNELIGTNGGNCAGATKVMSLRFDIPVKMYPGNIPKAIYTFHLILLVWLHTFPYYVVDSWYLMYVKMISYLDICESDAGNKMVYVINTIERFD